MVLSSAKFRTIAVHATLLIGLSVCAPAQWRTPSIDGIVDSEEFGNTADGTNQISSGGQTWFITWDEQNLYVAITNANLAEAAVLYIDANPQNPVFGGGNATGNIAGFAYDGEQIAQLPFRAQFAAYFKEGYREYRKSDGNGGWTGPTTKFGAFASSTGNGPNTRELAIPWSAITGAGLPSAFLFTGLLTSNSGYVYGEIPRENPSGSVGMAAAFSRSFEVDSTADDASTPPCSIEYDTASVNFGALLHNTYDAYYRDHEGAVPENTTVKLHLRTAHLGATSVKFRAYVFDTGSGNTADPVDTPMALEGTRVENGNLYDEWALSYVTASKPSIVYYKFVVNNGTATAFYSDDYLDDHDNLNKDGPGAPAATEPNAAFQITVYDPAFQTPAWLATANVYQIFADRFRNGSASNDYCVSGSSAGCPSFYGNSPSATVAVNPWNSLLCDPRDKASSCYNNPSSVFYGGDLKGVQDELDYIQNLGFDTIYLTPIFQASSNHRYDTDDFLNVDPALGGDAAFTALITAMKQRGMRVILDGVFNHASSDSTYFNRYNRFPSVGACQSLSSTYRTWFHFNDNVVPCSSADYPAWWGYDSLPTFDHTQTAVQKFFYGDPVNSVMAKWYAAGASGWRFDVAPDPNFPRAWWVATRKSAKAYRSDGPLIGEIWPNASQWLAGDQLDSTMNYRFRRNVLGFARGAYQWTDENNNGNDAIIPLTPSEFDLANRAVRDDYPPQATAAMLNLLDSHDTNRALYVLTELGDNGLTQAKQRLKLAALFQFTYLGAPMVFYGDEAGINAPSRNNGANGPIGDPYSRAPYPWTDQAGDASVYGPPDQQLIAFYTRLAQVRKQHPELAVGTFVTLLTGDTQQPARAANTYAYARISGSSKAIVALNNGVQANTASIPVNAYFANGSVLQDALTGNTYTVSGGAISLTLSPISGVLLLPTTAQ